ncbi:flippase-like domain-containing protein [Bradyrhizobium sp. 180]|nr:flippase-like domain-containing protein [Bradyrhizobium sp. 180]
MVEVDRIFTPEDVNQMHVEPIEYFKYPFGHSSLLELFDHHLSRCEFVLRLQLCLVRLLGRFKRGGVGFLIFGALKWRWLKTWWATHHLHACAVIANRVIFSRSRGPIIAILSILVHVLAVVLAWCVVQSIAARVRFSDVFLLVPPVMLITMIPISIAGLGVREATMGLAFGFAGLAANEGVNVSLLYGALFFIVGAFGGLVWILSAEKAWQGGHSDRGARVTTLAWCCSRLRRLCWPH